MIAPPRSGFRNSLIEALNLVPDFFEDLVSNNFLDALPRGSRESTRSSAVGRSCSCNRALAVERRKLGLGLLMGEGLADRIAPRTFITPNGRIRRD
jgi:hypothetical protein